MTVKGDPKRTALVTGANRGIGLETSLRLAKMGLRVVLTAREGKAAEREAKKLGAEGLDVLPEELDVAREDAAESLSKRLTNRGVRVDVLVNNAGVYPQRGVLDASIESFREALEVNFLGALRACRAFVPGMVRAGYGRVVNVSSGYGSFGEGLEGPAPYSISKAALGALTVKLAQEVRGDVKVNAVCPGWVRTRMGGKGADLAVEDSVDTILWLATLPADGANGSFFRDRQPIPW
jgi:NAD(P)-dependent dehydrogenase (short-subunit alcohol dehydrogenase family)